MNFNEIIFIAVGNNPLMCHSDSMLFVNRDAVIVAQVPLQKNSSQEKIDFIKKLLNTCSEWFVQTDHRQELRFNYEIQRLKLSII